MDQELCILKTRCGVMDQELEEMCNELKISCHEQDKYKEERDELLKLSEYWKHRALEKTTHQALVLENFRTCLIYVDDIIVTKK